MTDAMMSILQPLVDDPRCVSPFPTSTRPLPMRPYVEECLAASLLASPRNLRETFGFHHHRADHSRRGLPRPSDESHPGGKSLAVAAPAPAPCGWGVVASLRCCKRCYSASVPPLAPFSQAKHDVRSPMHFAVTRVLKQNKGASKSGLTGSGTLRSHTVNLGTPR